MEVVSEVTLVLDNVNVPELVSEVISIYRSKCKSMSYDRTYTSQVVVRIDDKTELRVFGSIEKPIARITISIVNPDNENLACVERLLSEVENLETLSKSRIVHSEITAKCLCNTILGNSIDIGYVRGILKNHSGSVGIVVDSMSTKSIGELSLVSMSGRYLAIKLGVLLVTIVAAIRSRRLSIAVSLTKSYKKLSHGIRKHIAELVDEARNILNFLVNTIRS